MKTFQRNILLLILLGSSQILLAAAPAGQVIWWGSDISNPTSAVLTGVVATEGQVLNDAVAIAAGEGHALALKSDGTVFGWGFNLVGQATGGEGTVLGWRPNINGQGSHFESTYPEHGSGLVKVGDKVLSNVVAIAAAGHCSLALKNNGTVAAWGDAGPFNEMLVPARLSNVVAIAAGNDRYLALKKDGTLVGWGGRKIPTVLSNIVAIATTGSDFGHDLALKHDGTVIELERNGSRISAPAGASNVIAIATGRLQKIALKNDGTLFVWGSGDCPPSGLSNIVAIAVQENSLALKSDGTVVVWGVSPFSPYHRTDAPAGLSNVVAISVGPNFCLAITTNRAVAERFLHNK